jgi:hypothetical protein
MRSVIPLILLLTVTVNAFSQEPYQLQFIHNGTGDTTDYEQGHITSDYGPPTLARICNPCRRKPKSKIFNCLKNIDFEIN